MSSIPHPTRPSVGIELRGLPIHPDTRVSDRSPPVGADPALETPTLQDSGKRSQRDLPTEHAPGAGPPAKDLRCHGAARHWSVRARQRHEGIGTGRCVPGPGGPRWGLRLRPGADAANGCIWGAGLTDEGGWNGPVLPLNVPISLPTGGRPGSLLRAGSPAPMPGVVPVASSEPDRACAGGRRPE